MVNINKNIKLIINYVAGPLLLLLIGYLFVQWGLEAVKWKMMLKATAFPVKWVTSLKMIFAGLSFSFVTPNRLGEFIGRIMYLPSDKRAVGTAFTVYNIIIQITVYCFFASIALYFLDASLVSHKLPRLVSNMLHGLQIISPIIFLLSVIFFVMQHRILSLLSNLSFLRKLKPTLGECMQLGFDTSFALIGLTLLKSLVFIFQYWLIFTWLGVELSFFSTFIGVSLMVFGLVVIPTVSFLEIGLRWELSYLLFSMYTSNLLGITIGATIIWFLNVVLPAIIGAFWVIVRPIAQIEK
ncbi:MAG: flippase-like domain-containing protein [Chitinophagaceae bacterium]|nr:flippase-like domain-containing protein [Chitinophagaceae bacterium]